MSKTKAWISAARLRTLPLSISGIIIAAAIASLNEAFSWPIFIGSLLVTLGFQVLSNFANDYGDGLKGTDNENRVGPARAMQTGALTAKELKQGIWITALITFVLSLALIYIAFGHENFLLSIIYILLGIAAIAAAIKYTVGSSAYGYRALGDLFVFIFFGLVSVVGGTFLYTQELTLEPFLYAVIPGFWSTAVLNLNNMRDADNDLAVGKITMAVKLGKTGSKVYHSFLILGGVLMASFLLVILAAFNYYYYLALLPCLILIIHLVEVWKQSDPKGFDPELKKVALSTFLFALILFLVLVI